MLSPLDDIGLRSAADIIYSAGLAGIPKHIAWEHYALWELAAARGLHLTETLSEYQRREIDEKKRADWEREQKARTELMTKAAERRRETRRRR